MGEWVGIFTLNNVEFRNQPGMRVIKGPGDIYTVALEAGRMEYVTKSMTYTGSTLNICFEYDLRIDLNLYKKQLFPQSRLHIQQLKILPLS